MLELLPLPRRLAFGIVDGRGAELTESKLRLQFHPQAWLTWLSAELTRLDEAQQRYINNNANHVFILLYTVYHYVGASLDRT